MRFLLDQNLPVGLVAVLAELGHEAAHVKPLGLAEADDRAVWSYAVENGCVVVSKDSDFATLAGQGAKLVRLRIGNQPNIVLYAIVRSAWAAVVARLHEGEVMVDIHG